VLSIPPQLSVFSPSLVSDGSSLAVSLCLCLCFVFVSFVLCLFVSVSLCVCVSLCLCPPRGPYGLLLHSLASRHTKGAGSLNCCLLFLASRDTAPFSLSASCYTISNGTLGIVLLWAIAPRATGGVEGLREPVCMCGGGCTCQALVHAHVDVYLTVSNPFPEKFLLASAHTTTTINFHIPPGICHGDWRL